MTTEIVEYRDTISGAEVKLSLADVKRLFCPKATDQEAVMFIELCKYQGLNPFVRDAYLLKYSADQPASMVVGKDSFTKRAEAHPQFAGMVAGVIVQVDGSEPVYRKGSLVLDGEKLVGGWGEVHRHDRTIPVEIPVTLGEYNTNRSSWQKMPATMIRKVALVQALREAFPNTFAGLYDSAEMGVELPDEGKPVAATLGPATVSFVSPPAPTEPPAETETPQEPEGGDGDKDESREPQAVEEEIAGPFCTEHGVSYKQRTSEKSGNTRWCHQKPDNSWCVYDESQMELATV